MVVHDNEYMCVLCDARCDSQQAYVDHLAEHNGQRIRNNVLSRTNSTPCPNYPGNNLNRLASPFAPTRQQSCARSVPQQQHQQQPNAHYTHAYTASPSAPAATFTTGHQLLTPPSSRGTASAVPAPGSVPTATQFWISPSSTSYGTPQQAPFSPSQQNGYYMVAEHMLQRGQQAYLTPHQLPQQTLQRQMSTSAVKPPKAASKAKALTPTDFFSNIPAKLDPKLPPLPQAVFDLGLKEVDFDPDFDDSQFCIASKYVDIPESVNIADEHLFNANSSTILGFGNLLRLASRYQVWELTAKFNANRPVNSFKNALIKKRLLAAVKWAADRPEWQHVGDVQTWLDEKQRARQYVFETQSCKRKWTDSNCEPNSSVFQDAAHTATTDQDGSRFSTPPPAKRARNTTWMAPYQLLTPLDGGHVASGTVMEDTQHAGHSSPSSDIILIDHLSTSPPAPDTASEDVAQQADPSPGQPSEHASVSAQICASADFSDLSNILGAESALALADTVGMIREHHATAAYDYTADLFGEIAAVHETSESVCETVVEAEDYGVLFKEAVDHPENFMSAQDLRMGTAFAEFAAFMRFRKGWQ